MAYKPIKPFLTYEKQMDNLEFNKNLIIEDRNYAREKLQNIRYYSLIDGYKILFYNSMIRQYEKGTKFEDIVALYEFDKMLRGIVFQGICSIEQKIRSLISHYFCERFSENQSEYLNPKNYNNTNKNFRDLQKLISILSNEANKNTEHEYVVYQRKTYGNVPLWVILNTLTMGQTSKMYSLLTTSLQSQISKNYKNVTEKELAQYLKVLTHFRNICAHNERLFSFKSRYEIPDTVLHDKMKISKKGNQYVCGKSDIFSVFITFRYLLDKREFGEFRKNFAKLLKEFEKQTSYEKKEKLLDFMGLPINWSSILRYKI